MHLIVVESPGKCEKIKKYAAAAGVAAKVVATKGHLVDLPPMQEGACVSLETFEPERLEPETGEERG